jgi:hypothetical protein
MKYPTDQHQRGMFIQNYNRSRWPIDVDANLTSTNHQTSSISPTISASRAPRNMSPGWSEMVFGKERVPIQLHQDNPVHTSSTFMHTGMSVAQENGGILAASNFSFMAGRSYPHDATWPDPEDNDRQRHYGNQISICDINPYMFDFAQMTSEPCITPGASTRILQTHSDFDRSCTQCDTLSPVNFVPLVQQSHEQFASVIFHQQWDHWEGNPCCHSVPTPGTRFSLSVPPTESFQIPSQDPNTTQKPHLHSAQYITPSVNDSGYGGSRSSTVSEASKIDVSFHPSSLAGFEGLCHLHEPQLAQYQGSQPQEQTKDLQICNECFYSGLHTLSCSARHSEPDVSQTELENTNFELEQGGIFDDDPYDPISAADGDSGL